MGRDMRGASVTQDQACPGRVPRILSCLLVFCRFHLVLVLIRFQGLCSLGECNFTSRPGQGNDRKLKILNMVDDSNDNNTDGNNNDNNDDDDDNDSDSETQRRLGEVAVVGVIQGSAPLVVVGRWDDTGCTRNRYHL